MLKSGDTNAKEGRSAGRPFARPLHRLSKHRKPTKVRLGAYELTKSGDRGFDWRDPYHIAVGLSWPRFLLALALIEIVINCVFGTLYWLQPGSIANARPGSFADALFFSFETLATVGYGAMAPATTYAHIIVTLELLCGTAFMAIITGLTFVRFSRAKPRFLYADTAVVTTINGMPTLMIRTANGRPIVLTQAKANLYALIPEWTQEGQFYRRVHDLPLVRDNIPIFPLTWTVMHRIEPGTPLADMSPEQMEERRVRIFLVLSAHDSTLAATVTDTRDFAPANILFGMRYADAVSMDEQGRTLADLTLLSATEADIP